MNDKQSERDLEMNMVRQATELQSSLATIDLFLGPSKSGGTFATELIVLKLQNLRIKMDGCRNHARAHIHIDYGKNLHAASFAVDTGERLAGTATPHDRAIKSWISDHQKDLMVVWDGMRASGASEVIVAKLLASGFGKSKGRGQ